MNEEDQLRARIKEKLSEYGEWMLRLQQSEERVDQIKKEIHSLDIQFTEIISKMKKVKKKKEDAVAHG